MIKQITNKYFDVVIIGAGAAGLMCAMIAGQRGRSVLVIDHANKPGKKILMSGGGRCNFTNYYIEAQNFLSNNRHFCKSALAKFTQWDFIALVEKHQVPYHEKKLGQLFCDNKSKDILDILLSECQQAGVEIILNTKVKTIQKLTSDNENNQDLEDETNRREGRFLLETVNKKDPSISHKNQTIFCLSLVVACGGLSVPTMGATGFGYQIARNFGLKTLTTRAGLVPFTFPEKWLENFSELSGTSLEVIVSCGSQSFKENILFTHRGMSGPAILQISSYWNLGDEIEINLMPDIDANLWLSEKQKSTPDALLSTALSEFFTKKLAQKITSLWFENKPLKQFNHKELDAIAQKLHQWHIKPHGTEGYRTAEVTLGGVDTDGVSSKTMESLSDPGLYFIGEVLDVSGHLGGYNFQWAWASGFACGQSV